MTSPGMHISGFFLFVFFILRIVLTLMVNKIESLFTSNVSCALVEICHYIKQG